MLNKERAYEALRKLFGKNLIADLPLLLGTLDTTSRTSVFRRLKELGYCTSYTHAGRYYTLLGIPRYDEMGLWFCRTVGFSRLGTLRATLVHLVHQSRHGLFLNEIRDIVRTKVQAPLLDLISLGEIARQKFEGRFIYISHDESRAEEQLDLRGAALIEARTLPQSVLVEVLVEAIHAGGVYVPPATVATRLNTRGIAVTPEAVTIVFERYGLLLEKKTARFP